MELIRDLEPWTETTDYSPRAWAALKQLARIVQRTDTRTVELALDAFMSIGAEPPRRAYILKRDRNNRKGPTPSKKDRSDNPESKPYLLMRVVFDVPEDAPRGLWFSFAGWYHRPEWFIYIEPQGDRVNLAWPISWNNGQPRLVQAFAGAHGPPYAARREYRYLREHFKYRDLD